MTPTTIRLLFAIIVMALGAGPAAASDLAHSYLRSAMAAMGGEAKLRGIRAVDYRAVGTQLMVEQSERPTGPYFIDHFGLHEVRDLGRTRTRIEQTDEAYAADKWWLDEPEPTASTTILNDDVAAVPADGKYTFGGGFLVQDNQEQFAFAPERLLQTAAAAADLRAFPDVILHGVRHHVLAFTWNRAPCLLSLNAQTNLPWSIRWTRNYPYQIFLNAWGDVTSSITYNAWTLEPYGISYPREWTYVRLGLPDTQLAIVSLKINPALSDSDLTVPADIYAAHHHALRAINAIPLGTGGTEPAHEIVPGIFFYSGSWNVSFIKQDAGTVILEAPWSTGYTQQAIDAAIKRYGRPIAAVITTSDSWPHIAGVRQAVARGIPVYALDLNVPILKRLIAAPHRQQPDLLAEHPIAPRFRIVAHDTYVGSGHNRLEIIPYRTATGERQMMVYFPEHRLLYTSDLFAPQGDGDWFTPQYLHEFLGAVAREHLAVQTIFGMHYDPIPYQNVIAYERQFLAHTASPTPAPSTPAPTVLPSAVASPLASLAYFLGHWQCSGSFPSTGKSISSTMRFEQVLAGAGVLKHHDDDPPYSYHAIEAWSYNADDHQFISAITDNFGGIREFSSTGWNGDVLTWSGQPEVQPTQQFVYLRLPDGSMRVNWQVSKDGTHYSIGDTLLCVKS